LLLPTFVSIYPGYLGKSQPISLKGFCKPGHWQIDYSLQHSLDYQLDEEKNDNKKKLP
jgi:hypothetical protein